MSFPAQVTPESHLAMSVRASAGPVRWAGDHRSELSEHLRGRGSVLLSGLGVRSADELAAVRDALGLRSAALQEQFAERRDLAAGVYSAPAWPADREQCLHHEQGYGIDFPGVLLIACLTPAKTGGAMLLGDTREVLNCLPQDLVARFRATGWLLERNFRPNFGVSWSSALGTSSPDEVEKICSERLIACTWESDGALHLTQRRSAIVSLPTTGQECWFNDVAFFSQWSVPAEERQVLLGAFGDHGIPFNTRFGDGEAISEQTWRSILDAYEAAMRRVQLQAGDLLIVDNMRCAHGREPYTGDWELAIAPTETVSLPDRSPGRSAGLS